jgi:hypothetical protein
MIEIMRIFRGIFRAMVFVFVLIGPLRLASARQTVPPKKEQPAAGTKAGPKVPTGNAKDLFVDVTRAAGIDFHLTCGSKEKLYILETQCGGAAALDYDNDGLMDVLLVEVYTLED